MRAIEVTKPGGPEVLGLTERPVPDAEAGQVVIRNEFVGVNFADLWRRLAAEPGDIPGIESAGVVHAVGDGVEGFTAGDRVVGLPYFTLATYAEYTSVPATHVFHVPDGVGLDVAAATPVNYLTAAIALERTAQVRSGETVLIHAAAGGVGLAGTQLAAAAGARVIATASPAKHDFLQAQPGVFAVVDYTQPAWDDEVRSLSDGGVDLVVDGTGEEGYLKSLGTLAYGGRLVAYGVTAAMTDASSPSTADEIGLEELSIPMLTLFEHSWTFSAITGDAPSHLLSEWLAAIFERVGRGELAPRIDKRFAFEDASEAHRYLHERRNIGKVVLEV